MRTVQNESWQTVASAPRRSYLGKYRRLTPSQSRWVRSLLNLWGSIYGGSGIENLSGNRGFWAGSQNGWTVEQQERIETVLNGLREIGYQGEALFIMAQKILWPKRALGELIGSASDEEEAEFMESIILKSFSENNPVYEIGRDYYTWSKSIINMARWLNYQHAPFLTEKQCIDRVRWCIELFNSAVYFTMVAELCRENSKNSEKDLQTSFETA